MGKYLLLERLATGGMAEVYRAKTMGASGFEKQLAIKKILPSHVEDETFQRMFETEARIGSSLAHSNIVQILDFVKFGETFLLVMEFVNGGNLRQVINKLKKLQFALPLECALYIINETCKGLDYAHSKKDDYGQPQNIIHRDMSPQNIMLSYEGAIKIVDFGIANWKDKLEQTKSGVIKGKFGYMSPEQAAGQGITNLTDVFSTGIIFWELLTGRRLFTAESDLSTLRLIQDCVIPKPSTFNNRVSPELERIVLKSLAKNTAHRYQSAGAMQKQIQEYLYKHYPTFRGNEIASMMQRLFKEEIASDSKRFEQLNRQSVPFSQSNRDQPDVPEAEENLEDQLDGSLTASAHESLSHVTFIDEDKNSFGEMEPPLSSHENDLKTKVSNANTNPAAANQQNFTSTPQRTNSLAASTISRTKENPKPIESTEAKTILKKPEPSTNLTLKKSQPSSPSESFEAFELETSVTTKRTRESWGSMNTGNVERPIEDSPRPAPLFSKGKVVAASFLFMVTAYLYHLLLSGKSVIPVKVEGIDPRLIGSCDPKTNKSCQISPAETKSTNQSKSAITNCEIRFETDPPGAALVIDGVEKFLTPGTALVPCDTSINYSLQLKDYDVYAENIYVKPQMRGISKSLKKIQTGNLVITTNRRVKLYSATDFIGETEPGKPFLIERAPANREFKIRFLNEVFGIDETRSFSVQEGVSTPYEIKLDDGSQ